MDEKNYFAIGCGVAVLVALAGFFLFAHPAVAPISAPGTSATSTTTTSAAPQESAGANKIPVPNLDRPYTPPAGLPASVQAESKQAVADAVAQLKLNTGLISYWLQLAVYRKGSADFAGAEEIWLYVVARWPGDPTAYNNLADLYGNYTRQYDKAVLYWKKLIAQNPQPTSIAVAAYLNLASLQRIQMNDPTAARATLEAGLKANPGNADLQHALASLSQ